jgi:cell division protein ZapE
VDDLMPRYAEHVSKTVELLCFDEFHVTDVADAMLLGRLFAALLERGVIIVATSNWAPDDLYEGGLQRDLFLPFIALLKQRMEIVHLDSEHDYRQMADPDQDVYYFYPLNAATKERARQLFLDYAQGQAVMSDSLEVKKRIIEVKQSANGAAKFGFSELCEQPHGAEDFIAIARSYHTVFITDIPRLTYDRRNEVKRLILLIDCLYEEGCRVVITADAAVDSLYHDGNHAFEFDRTISRLIEMQSSSYHETASQKRARL